MAFKKSNEVTYTSNNLHITLIVNGVPSSGKSTTAYGAAPEGRVLVIDSENSIIRVEACYRAGLQYEFGGKSSSEKFENLKKELISSDLSEIDAIVIDTVDSFINSIIIPCVQSLGGANIQKETKTLSQKGYGVVGNLWADFYQLLVSLNKDIILVTHSEEVQSTDDTIKVKMGVPGASRKLIEKEAHLACYLEFVGKTRIAHFTPTSSYFAKSGYGVKNDYTLPELKATLNGGDASDNHFLYDIISVYKKNFVESQELYSSAKTKYSEVMNRIGTKIAETTDVEGLNDTLKDIMSSEHYLTSKVELASKLSEKAKELGADYDKESKQYRTKA